MSSENGEINTGVNIRFCELRDELKGHLTEILQWMITLNLCISLRIPKIEDGNNFGVNVQHVTHVCLCFLLCRAVIYLFCLTQIFGLTEISVRNLLVVFVPQLLLIFKNMERENSIRVFGFLQKRRE